MTVNLSIDAGQECKAVVPGSWGNIGPASKILLINGQVSNSSITGQNILGSTHSLISVGYAIQPGQVVQLAIIGSPTSGDRSVVSWSCRPGILSVLDKVEINQDNIDNIISSLADSLEDMKAMIDNMQSSVDRIGRQVENQTNNELDVNAGGEGGFF